MRYRLPGVSAVLAAIGWAIVSAHGAHALGSVELELAANDEAALPIVIGEDAGDEVRKTAEELADYLERISGAPFSVETGDGSGGIVMGVPDDFEALPTDDVAFDHGPLHRDHYVIRSKEEGLYLLGATPLAVQHATWDLLYRLGHRQFFPTDTWEVVPELPEIRVALDVSEQPEFYNRMGPRGAPGRDREIWSRWHDRNRMTSGFSLRTGHQYSAIIRRNQEAFDANPEFLALVDGERGGSKFCISNDDLRALVVEDAINRTDRDTDSITMDPSDGGGWCECEPCAEMGSVSDRVVLLANEVAEAIDDLGYGEKYVGIYAYAGHSPPPNVEVHPKVVVSVATGFIRGGYTFEELLDGWSAKAPVLGIRDYHDVHTWSRAMPRRARGGNVRYLVDRIPYYYERGARFMNSESSDSWGANGLGYYLSAHLLWDTEAAGNVDALIEDFVDKAFGSAHEPMREFYHLIAEDHETTRTNEDLLARMYEALDEARRLSHDAEVMARLDELALYTRYVELMLAFEDARGEARDEIAPELFRHGYRMRDTILIPIRSLYRNLRNRQGIEVPEEANPHPFRLGQASEDLDPWMSSEPFTAEEIDGFVREGVANHEKTQLDFETVSFSDDLVPAADRLELAEVETGRFSRSHPSTFRRDTTMYTWFESNEQQLVLNVTGGTIWQDRGNVRFELHSPKEVFSEPVAVDESVEPTGEVQEVVLETPYSGLHQLEWSDGNAGTSVEWPENWPMTIRSSMDDPANLRNSRWNLYFYVPKGTQVVAGYATNNRGTILDVEGNEIFDFTDLESPESYFEVDVPEGKDGQIWKFHNSYGRRKLMTVPPYLARNARELMLPREVVEADAPDAN